MASIIYSPNNTWNPEHEGCQFGDAYERACRAEDRQFAYFKDNDGYTFQITEDNAVRYFNDTNEEMQACALADPRDRNAWWWFPACEAWEVINEAIEVHGSHIYSIVPRPEVVRNWMRIYGKMFDE